MTRADDGSVFPGLWHEQGAAGAMGQRGLGVPSAGITFPDSNLRAHGKRLHGGCPRPGDSLLGSLRLDFLNTVHGAGVRAAELRTRWPPRRGLQPLWRAGASSAFVRFLNKQGYL